MKQEVVIKILLLIILLFNYACSTTRPEGSTEAEILFKEAQQMVEDKRYLLATEKLNLIKSKYPYSFYATHAEMLQADILFKQENYIEAAAAYTLFMEFHPKHEDIIYVLWQIAESYYNQLPSKIDRDLSSANEAIKYYNELISRYPESSYIESARKKIKDCEDMLKNREKYIADFYYRTNDYESALFHYKLILKNFNDVSLQEHAAIRVIDSLYNLKKYSECLEQGEELLNQVSNDFKNALKKTVSFCKKKINSEAN